MSTVNNRVEWQVLDNCRNAKPATHGFTKAPDNLPGVMTSLKKRGLIKLGTNGLFFLTTSGVTAHQAGAGKFSK